MMRVALAFGALAAAAVLLPEAASAQGGDSAAQTTQTPPDHPDAPDQTDPSDRLAAEPVL